MSENECFRDDMNFTWVAVHKHSNGFSAKRVVNCNVLGDSNYPLVGVIHWDGILRTTYNNKDYEIKMNKLDIVYIGNGEEIYEPKDNTILVNEVICELEKRYELIPKKKIENKKFYNYPMLARMKTDNLELIGLLKEPKNGESEVIILYSIGSFYMVGQIIQTNPNLWVPLEETFHMKNT